MSDEEGEMDSKPPRVDKRRKHTKLDDVQLIQLVKAHKALYEADDEDYHNQVRRDEIWQEIGKRMGRKMSDCRRRWFNIRDCYRRSISKRRSRSHDGDSTKRWRYSYEKHMTFMLPHMRQKKKRYWSEEEGDGDPLTAAAETQDYDEPEVCVEQIDGVEAQECAENENNSPQEILKTFTESESRLPDGEAEAASDLSEILQDLAAWRREEQQTKRDHIWSFFKSIEDTVRTLPFQRQIEAKKQISALVFDLELKAGSEQSQRVQMAESSYTE